MSPRRTATTKRTKAKPRKKKKATSSAPKSRLWSLTKRAFYLGLGLSFIALVVWAIYLDVVVREKFDGKKWSLPARVYARPLELYVGLALTPTLFERELKALGYQFTSRAKSPGYVARRVNQKTTIYEMHTRGFEFWDAHDEPLQFTMTVGNDRVISIADTRGSALPLVRLEPEQIGGIYPTQREDRLLVQLSDLPPLLGETLLAVEDQHFLQHFGVSPSAILRAAWVNLRSGNVVQGGSTLTQQLVKNFYLTHERSLRRKAQEAMMSLLLELHYSKSEILETYINEVFLGQSGARAIHGFALASHYYFRQPVAELNTEQIALLVGLVKGASFYNPWRHPKRAKKRRDLVLKVMRREGLIEAAQYKKAVVAPLGVVSPSRRSQVTYPAFVSLVKQQLRENYRDEDLQSEGLRVFTTLSPMVQREAEQAVSSRLKKLEALHKVSGLQAGMVVTSVGAGEVLAMVGDKNPRFEGFNRAVDAKRPIGSLVKPFVYLTALERAREYHLGSMISDDPVSVGSQDGEIWQPKNANLISHGNVPLVRALVHSYNQATARLGMNLGLAEIAGTLQAAGFSGTVPEVPALSLGSVNMSPLDVAAIYHTIAAEGAYTPLRAIRDVLTATGEPLKRYPLQLEQRFSAESTYQIQYALQMVLREGTGKRVYHQFPAHLPLAGKTGTTNDLRDSWFAGFSGEHLAAVWVGRDDNGKTPLTGSGGALQIWTDLMLKLPTRGVNLDPPEGVGFDWIDETTGLLSAEGCEKALWLPMRTDMAPMESAPCRLRKDANRSSWWHRFWR